MFFCVCAAAAAPATSAAPRCVPPPGPSQSARIAKVIDGDTLALADGRHVRLIGVNTPEKAHHGQRAEAGSSEATRFVERFLSSAGVVRISPGKDPKDRYGRTLAHVFRADGASLEEALLEQGLAMQIVIPPNLSLADCLQAAEHRAREARRGLWKPGASVAKPVSALQAGEQGFRLVRGRVSRVERAGSSWWIELESRVSLRVAREDWKHFGEGFPESLRGQVVEARGWLVWRRKGLDEAGRHPPWMLRLRHPVALSLEGGARVQKISLLSMSSPG